MDHRHLAWVRHARVDPDPTTPADEWPLTSQGREDAARLARSLADLQTPLGIVTSDERKAIETAEEIASTLGLAPPEVSPGLREVQRPWTDGDYRAVVRAYLRSGTAPGWESCSEARQRLSSAIAELWRPEGTTIVVGHGLAMSIWAADAIDRLDAVAFWDGLTFPDAWLFTDGGTSLRRIVE